MFHLASDQITSEPGSTVEIIICDLLLAFSTFSWEVVSLILLDNLHPTKTN